MLTSSSADCDQSPSLSSELSGSSNPTTWSVSESGSLSDTTCAACLCTLGMRGRADPPATGDGFMPPAKGSKISRLDESLVTALMIESKISTEITKPSDIKDIELSDSSTCRFSGKSTRRFSGKQKGGTWPAETGKDPAFTTQNCRFSGKTCDIPFLRMSPTKSCWSGCSLSSDDAIFAGFFTGSEVVPSAIFCDHRQKWLGDHVTGDRVREIYFFLGEKFSSLKWSLLLNHVT